jgi:hypothetical protein
MFPLVRFAIAVVVALLVACSSDEPAPSISGGAGHDVGGGEAIGGSGGAAIPATIALDASSGVLALDFDIAISGAGSAFVGAVDLFEASGSIELGGVAYDALIYEQQPFAPWVLYQTLAVASDRWFVVWHYCNGDALEWIWYEGTDGTALTVEPASGTCAAGPGPIAAAVNFDAVDMPLPPLVDGFTIFGANVDIGGAAPGHVTLGSDHLVLPFEHVDCTTTCGTPGWRELHALLWDVPAARACFGIFYLFDDDPQVLLTYAITLPDLSDPVGNTLLDATWSFTPP